MKCVDEKYILGFLCWDRYDHVAEVENQLHDEMFYKKILPKDKMLEKTVLSLICTT